MSERIEILHPDPTKQTTTIDKKKYEVVKDSIISTLEERESITFKELTDELSCRLKPDFEGSIAWYCTSVKLDLEARGIVERIPRSRPQRLVLNQHQ
ncbi:hypothetical protein LCL89_12995 [Halobacillus yeomjeoni]|uniref:DUF6958 family protein n=1 Tax=Halobacillus yeomjeoni TaxID=311194 RepID=UPI001CD4ECF7|nr:hypothetical protein [Halobacillus yeomjeoni]MCA0984953.1 hypothetical protein [Halobacillus yeomjeoni]